MLFTNSFTIRPPGAPADECISALLDVASASDFTLKLMRKCGCVVDYVSLEPCDRAEIARWVNERVEEVTAYEGDMRDIDADYERWRDEQDMRKAEGE